MWEVSVPNEENGLGLLVRDFDFPAVMVMGCSVYSLELGQELTVD